MTQAPHLEQFLSPRQLAESLGVSESSVKRWADNKLIAISRTAGGHRRIALSDALRFIRDNQMAVLQPQILGMTAAKEEPEHSWSRLICQYLLAGATQELIHAFQSFYLQGGSIAALADGPIRQAFAHIGGLWEHQEDGIMIEHRAVDCCLKALLSIRNLLPQPSPQGPRAVGAAPPDDPYILPSMLAAMVLEEAGWQAVNLGANTPWHCLAQAVGQLQPQLLWLSVSSPLSEQQAQAGSALFDALRTAGLAISVGGRYAENLGHPSTCDSLQDLAVFAQHISGNWEASL